MSIELVLKIMAWSALYGVVSLGLAILIGKRIKSMNAEDE